MKRFLTTVIVFACLAGTSKPLVAQQPGQMEGQQGFPDFHLPGPPSLERGQHVQSGTFLLLLSKSGDTIWGFSNISGKWSKQPLTQAVEKIEHLMLGNEVAALWIGQKVYAFSSRACRWDTLPIPEGQEVTPVFNGNAELLIVPIGSNLFVFSPQTGRWASPKINDEEPAAKDDTLVDRDSMTPSLAAGVPGAQQLRSEPRSVKLARQIRQLIESGGDASKRAPLEARLRQVVAKEFKERQERQQGELERLKKRLARIEQLIDARKKAKDEIIRRRIEELLNPALRWDGVSLPSAEPAPASRSRGTSSTGGASTLPGATRELKEPVESTPQETRADALAPVTPSPIILRSAEAIGRRLSEAEAELHSLIRAKEVHGIGDENSVERARRNLRRLRAEYEAQLRLLELELADAKSASQAAEQSLRQLQQLYRKNVVPQAEVSKAQRERDATKVRITKIETLLHLYRQVGQTNEDKRNLKRQDAAPDATGTPNDDPSISAAHKPKFPGPLWRWVRVGSYRLSVW